MATPIIITFCFAESPPDENADEKLSTSLPWSTGCAADIRFARVTSTLDTIRVGINCRSILNVLRHM